MSFNEVWKTMCSNWLSYPQQEPAMDFVIMTLGFQSDVNVIPAIERGESTRTRALKMVLIAKECNDSKQDF